MARIQTSFVDPEAEREAQEAAMLAMLARQPAAQPAPEAQPLPPEYAPDTAAEEPARATIAPPSTHVASLPPGPGNAEMDALANYQPRASWQNVLARVGAAIAESTGSPGSIARQHEAERSTMQERAAMIDAARQKDQGELPVDAGTAALLELGGMSPQAARGTTRSSPAIKLAQSGMGQLGARYRQQDLTAQQKADHDAAMLAMLERRLGTQKEIAQGRNETVLATTDKRTAAQLEAAKIRAHKGGGGAPASPEAQAQKAEAERNGVASWLAEYASAGGKGPTTAQARAFMEGNAEGLDSATIERLTRGRNQLESGIVDKAKVMQAGLAREAGNTDKPAVSAETKQLDPKARLALREEVSSVGRDIALADRAWRAMSDEGKKAFSQLAGNGGDIAQLVKSGRLSPEDQKNAAAVQALANQLIKARSGSAVTGSEWTRVAAEIGFPQGDWSLFNSPSVIGDWIDRAKGGWVRRKKTVASEYPDLWGGDGGP